MPQLEHVYYFMIERTIRKVKNHTQRLFTEHGLSLTGDQWVILKMIEENEGISQKEISQKIHKDPAMIARIISVLLKHKYIRRRANEADRRAYEVYMTPQGKELIRKTLPLVEGIRSQGIAGIPQDDLDILARVLGKMYDNFE